MTPRKETLHADQPKGARWEGCAIMRYLANKHKLTKLYPRNPEKHAMIDSALFYLTGTLYPLVARATLEILAAIDCKLKPWMKKYLQRLEEKLGTAYSDPAADVPSYIAHVKSQAK